MAKDLVPGKDQQQNRQLLISMLTALHTVTPAHIGLQKSLIVT
ncbi:hypothetical protein [Bathymodiolus japonicus methanotrophic gill symbiont]|nr:hypothetical protein [Bathymodiolus japonicus methanotrophic gill symbiont]